MNFGDGFDIAGSVRPGMTYAEQVELHREEIRRGTLKVPPRRDVRFEATFGKRRRPELGAAILLVYLAGCGVVLAWAMGWL